MLCDYKKMSFLLGSANIIAGAKAMQEGPEIQKKISFLS